MNFENKGKWLKEAQDKMAARDTMEDPDFLDGDDKVLTFEEEELDIEDNDIEEEPAQKNEAGSFEIGKRVLVKAKNNAPGRITKKVSTNGKAHYWVELKDGHVIDVYENDIVAESVQKNEAKIERDYDINFDNVGGGLTVEKVAITNGYGIELSGYSNNTSKKLTYVHPTLSNDRGKSQDEIEKNYNELNAKRIAIAKDMKAIADKFDKDIEAIFAKHGFKKA